MPTFDAVEDLGWDPTGAADISDSLEAHIDDDTTIRVPPGEYLFRAKAMGAARNFTLEGTGGDHRDAIFRPPSGYRGRFIDITGGSGVTLRNLSVDQYDDTQTSVNIRLKNNGFLIEDVEHLGFTPDDGSGSAGNQLALAAERTGATGTVRRYYNRFGGQIDSYPNRQAIVWVGAGHSGTITFQDCVIIEAGGSAIYATRHNGTVRVEGGYFANNDHHDMRISNERGDQVGWVRDAVFYGDYSDVNFSKTNVGHEGGEGWWIEHGGTELLVEDCDYVYRDPYPTNPAPDDIRGNPHFPGIVQIPNYTGPVTFRNCRFHHGVTTASPLTNPPGPAIAAQSGTITIENCTFTGPNDTDGAVASSTTCSVADSCVDMPQFDPGEAISGASTSNIAHSGCQVASVRGLASVYPGNASIEDPGEPVCQTDSECPTTAQCQDGRCVYPEPTDHTIVILGDGATTRYAFTVEGHVVGAGSGDLAGGDHDQVRRFDDREAVEGVTGGQPGTGDTWAFDLVDGGQVREFQFTEGEGIIEFDGREVAPADFPLPAENGENGTEPPVRAGSSDVLVNLALLGLTYWGFKRSQERS